MRNRDTQLVLFSGLGADARLYEPQQEALPELTTPQWLTPRSNESLTAYVQRWLPQLSLRGRYFLGGVSFGGMVALEMARFCRPAGVFLISSCRDAKYINGLYRLAALLPSVTPTPLSRWIIRTFGGMGLTWHEQLPPAASELVHRLAADPVMSIIKWGGRQMTTWRLNEPLRCPVYQVHGALDTAIYPQAGLCDLLIPNGRHLVNLTHPEVVNDFIRHRLEQTASHVRRKQHRRRVERHGHCNYRDRATSEESQHDPAIAPHTGSGKIHPTVTYW